MAVSCGNARVSIFGEIQMTEYPKIQSIFNRNEKSHKFIIGDYSLPEFRYLRNNTWIGTEKIDGTNIRVMWDGMGCITFGGKTDKAQIPIFLLERLQVLFPKEKFLGVYDHPVCLYGEGYGAKIQKGGKYIPDGVDFILFDVLIDEWWLKRKDIEDTAQTLEIKIVPIVMQGNIQDTIEAMTIGTKSQWGDFLAEGLVLKPAVELKTRSGERVITKMKHKDFR